MKFLKQHWLTFSITIAVMILGYSLGRQKARESKAEALSDEVRESSKFSQRSKSLASSRGLAKPDWAVANARARNPAEAQRMLEDLLKWAQVDPLAALAYVLENTRPLDEKERLITAILAQWSSESPEEAWAWACENSKRDCTELLQEIGKVDSELAWGYAQDHVASNPSQKMRSYEQVLLGLSYKEKYQEALDLVANLEVKNDLEIGNGRYYFVEGVVEKWFLYDPEAAQVWLKEGLEDGDVSVMRTAVSNLKASWAIKEPVAALGFALDLPEGEARHHITEAALNSLIDEDQFTFAMDWLNDYGSGPLFDHSVSRIATDRGLIAADATAAIGWANSIEEPTLRDDALGYLFAEWMTQDEEVASSYLANLEQPLSQEAKERMEVILKERREGVPLTEEDEAMAN